MRISTRRFVLTLILFAMVLAGCDSGSAAQAPVAATVPPAPVLTEAPVTEPTPTALPTLAPTAAPTAVKAAGPPNAGRWIDVDVTRFMVRLMDGSKPVREIGPVGVGREIDTGRYESTQTGLFAVYTKRAEQTYDAPYDTYIAWWVGFDQAKDNGFHSFLQDADGKTVDASTGRVSNGCIRSGQADAIYEYAEIGMPVWVHA